MSYLNTTYKDNKPLVSCIIVFFNTKEDFFSEAIESVFMQTFKNWELLLIDDGSTNDSTEIAQSYAQKYPGKVHYLEHQGHKNRGASATRNLGIQNAKGKYIAFLDADDVWLPHKLAQQVQIIKLYPQVAMVYGKSQYWHSWNRDLENAQSDYVPDLGVETNTIYEPPKLATLCYPLGKAISPCPSNLLINREALMEVGGFEENFKGIYQLYEDQVILTKIYLNFSVYVADKIWDKYRIHSDSCVSRVNIAGKYQTVRLYYLKWLVKYLNEYKINNNLVCSLLDKAMFPYRHPHIYYMLNKLKSLQVNFKKAIKSLAFFILTSSIKTKLKYCLKGSVNFGNLRRVTPISRQFGNDRGLPVDRFYIENFLGNNSEVIYGHVLEIKDAYYTKKFGGNRVTKIDVMHLTEGNPEATIIGDLTKANHIPSNTFDCIILTQTLHIIYDLRAALSSLYRILKPGGIMLATFPGISQVVKGMGDNDYNWAFTNQSAKKLFKEFFDKTNIKVENHGNVLAAISFLHGIAKEELTMDELLYNDDEYQVLIAVKAVKKQ